jgi:hypothetical protein
MKVGADGLPTAARSCVRGAARATVDKANVLTHRCSRRSIGGSHGSNDGVGDVRTSGRSHARNQVM